MPIGEDEDGWSGESKYELALPDLMVYFPVFSVVYHVSYDTIMSTLLCTVLDDGVFHFCVMCYCDDAYL